jgi:hypothetical protein
MFFGAPERIFARSTFPHRHALSHVADPEERSMYLAWESVAHCRFEGIQKSRNKERCLDPHKWIDGVFGGEICFNNPLQPFFRDPAATRPGRISAKQRSSISRA